MEISKPKLILMMIGSAVCGVIIFILAMWSIAYFLNQQLKKDDVTVNIPPIIGKPSTNEYLGSPQITSGKFDSMSKQKLSEGPGIITGKAIVDGEPCPGLKFSLALNGGVWSQWSTTDVNGKYTVKVPFGEYRIDGWKLDEKSSDQVIPGKIHHPSGLFTFSTSFIINEQKNGRGPIFSFVSPVKIIQPQGDVSYSEDLILEWETYPNAAYYRIEIHDYDDGSNLIGKRLFRTSSEEPLTRDTYINFKNVGVQLDSGHYYTATVWALNENMARISKSLDSRGFGFFILSK